MRVSASGSEKCLTGLREGNEGNISCWFDGSSHECDLMIISQSSDIQFVV